MVAVSKLDVFNIMLTCRLWQSVKPLEKNPHKQLPEVFYKKMKIL